ncbi:MAG: ABC transporter ATP-binding protein [Ahniella sp.]|nr:ABC transporter ATP-binding protein [Ahniella sp.]
MSISIRGVDVLRSDRPVLQGLTLELGPGEFVGLVGSNGSGKSSLLGAICGVLPVSAGQVLIDGQAAGTVSANRLLGRALDPALLPGGLTGIQLLELVCSARAGSRPVPSASLGLAEALKLSPFLNQAIARYSLGTRQKLAIVAGLIDEPPYWLLDESLNGLDPPSAYVLKQHLVAARARGITTLLATHGLEMAERQLSRVLVLHEGALRADWSEAQLLSVRADPGRSIESELVAAMTRPGVVSVAAPAPE